MVRLMGRWAGVSGVVGSGISAINAGAGIESEWRVWIRAGEDGQERVIQMASWLLTGSGQTVCTIIISNSGK